MDRKKKALEIAQGVIAYLEKTGSKDILGLIIDHLKHQLKVHDVVVFSPKELGEKEKFQVKKLIQRLTGERIDRIIFNEDKTLIDGLKIQYKDKLWDFSLASQVETLVKGES